MVSDRAALSVSVEAGIEEKEACGMHDGDKVGESATGKLTRTAMGVVVNPFAAGVALVLRAHKMAVQEEFRRVFPAWYKYDVDWKGLFPEAKLEGDYGSFDLLGDLIDLDMGRLYERIITTVNPSRAMFGFLPDMAGCSDGQIDALNAESFAERAISGANLVMTDGNTLLGDKELEMLVVLRMNLEFMEFMRREYADEIKLTQPYNMTVVEDECKTRLEF